MIRFVKARSRDRVIADRLEGAYSTLYDRHIDVDAALADFQQRTGYQLTRPPQRHAAERSWRAARVAACAVSTAVAVLTISLAITSQGHLPQAATGRTSGERPKAGITPPFTYRSSEPAATMSSGHPLPRAGTTVALPSGSESGTARGGPGSGVSEDTPGGKTASGETEASSGITPCFLGRAAGFMAALSPSCGMADGINAAEAGPSAAAEPGQTTLVSPVASAAAAQPSGSPSPSPTGTPTPTPTAP